MADSPNRTGSLRVLRTRGGGGPSRNSSARSSAAWDDYSYLHPSANYPSATHHSLRSASSRFSLNEQFAATRREFEFGDDDESSILERMTLASEAGGDDSSSTVAGGVELSDPNAIEGDYYDLLCLPRDPTLTPDQVRRAYHRLLLFLHRDGLPEHLHAVAQPYFNQVQRAFETLIDPHRRALYDANQLRAGTPVDDEEDYRYAYDWSLKEQLRQRAADVVQTSSDLGIRFDASKAVRLSSAVTPLDFTLSHSVTVGLPVLGRVVDRATSAQGQRATSGTKLVPSMALNEGGDVQRAREPVVYLPPPQVTLTGSVYGVLEEMYRIPLPLLADRYQPLLPLTIPRKRIVQLAEQRPCPLISLRLHQDIIHRTAQDRIAKTTVEVESEVLPESSLTARVSHPIHLPNTANPIVLEGSLRSGRPWFREPPRVGLGVHHWLGRGTMYAFADSGDWTSWTGESLRLLTTPDFSQVSKMQLLTEFPTKASASFEVGYTTSPERVPSAGHEDSPRGECGIRGLDYEHSIVSDGSWTVSASLAGHTAAAYLRYGRDVALPGSAKAARLEVELCSNTLLDRYVAVRNLWGVGRFSKLGLEFGVSLHGLHFSLYWSRLSQRLSIPLLLSPSIEHAPSAFFYVGAVPVALLAAKHFFFSNSKRAAAAQAAAAAGIDLQAYVARKRAAADDVAALLAGSVEARQRNERQRGGLVVLSAKFGIKEGGAGGGGVDDWAMEEVADVTVAVAALVEDGKLRIPAGVRKGSLLGFWDPAPLRKKALHVRYMYRGKEGTVEVVGRDELVLPPPTSRRDVS
ncbi:putative J domain-containing protein [Colletotrichum trifolii]|uniref:Putative J domain-containing protein n=1 Tax=Colletotrichum trifolii TaxID=5466 RepID=A0A4R8RM70_COLTR|nr:putative J domain-containing protein [Colletotrichum trifolii]